MNTRATLPVHQQIPKDLVTLVIEIMPRLEMVELQKLIMFAELELQDRWEKE